jgi:hypothetical protein
VPGQVYYAATRKLVLSGADGIVFVADTQTARIDSNHESLEDLNANLAEQGRKLSAVPHAFQWNKRDLPDLVPVDELDRRLNLFGAPSIPTVATTGEGVFTTLERVTRAVVEAYRADLPTASKVEGVPLYLDAEEIGLADAIKGLADAKPARPPSHPRRSPEVAPPASSRKGEAPASPSFASMPTPQPVAATATAFAQASAVAHALAQAVPSHAFAPGPVLGATSLAAIAPGVEAVPASAAAPAVASAAPVASPAQGTALAAAQGSMGGGSAPAAAQGAARISAGAEATPAFSLADLWPAGDRDAVRRAEQALATGDTGAAVAASEDLLTRVLAAGSVLLGGQTQPRDPVLLVTLLGLDGPRYLGFRGVARGMRSKRPPSLRDALECYAFALEARRALDRAGRAT